MKFTEKLTSLAGKIHKVFEAGKKAEYDAFWDAQQGNGVLEGRSCDYMFAGQFWTKETCVPKYDIIKPYGIYMMFALNQCITDMREWKKANGEKVILDTTGAKEMTYGFYRSKLTYIETVNTTSASSLGHMFNLCGNLETIELLILKDDGSQNMSTTFGSTSALKNITIQGKIGASGVAFPSTVLTKASIISIINALSSTTANGKTISLREAAIVSAFGSIDNAEWQALVATKPNWTISLS